MCRIPILTLAFAVALFVGGGCATTSSIEFDAENPLIRFTGKGLMFKERYVTPKEAVELLEKHRIPKDITLHLLVDRDYSDTRATWVFQRNFLARAGYTKSVLVYAKRREAMAADDARPSSSPLLTSPVKRHTHKKGTVGRPQGFKR